MSVLLREIHRIDPGAADILKQENFINDSEIQTLTREDLHELFPGPGKLKLRRTIFETIHKQKPIHLVLKDLQGLIPHDFRAALNNSGVLVDYLHILKDVKTQLNNVESFLNAHVGFVEDLSKSQPAQQQGQDNFGGGHSYMQKSNLSGTPSSGSATDGWETLDQTNYKCDQNEASSQKTQTKRNVKGVALGLGYKDSTAKGFDRSPDLSHAEKNQKQVTQNCGRNSEMSHIYRSAQRRQVNYKMVISGKTFGAHHQILQRMKGLTQSLNLVNMDENQTSEDCHVTFVFCPVVSRVGTDVESAMKEVKGSEPVILVLMHHSHEAKHVASFKTWEDSKILIHANVFYHEKTNGLIVCKENEDAISVIGNKLLYYFSK